MERTRGQKISDLAGKLNEVVTHATNADESKRELAKLLEGSNVENYIRLDLRSWPCRRWKLSSAI